MAGVSGTIGDAEAPRARPTAGQARSRLLAGGLLAGDGTPPASTLGVLPPSTRLGDAVLMILSDPPAHDLAETLYDEDRESAGDVMNGPDAGPDPRAAVLAAWARQLAVDPGATTPA